MTVSLGQETPIAIVYFLNWVIPTSSATNPVSRRRWVGWTLGRSLPVCMPSPPRRRTMSCRQFDLPGTIICVWLSKAGGIVISKESDRCSEGHRHEPRSSAEINSVRHGASPLDCYSDRLHSSYRRRSDGSELKLAARRRGEDVIDMSMGNPDEATPAHIVAKLINVGDTNDKQSSE
jgi:hypothetical protein